uniref:Uncharacterized protein n=2 Tax=Lutzomyia longipalpis TaxID=7200 RepID=A0A1B0CQB8_LUTLO
LVPDLDDAEASPSPKSESSASDCEEVAADLAEVTQHKTSGSGGGFTLSSSSAEDDEIGDGLRMGQTACAQPAVLARTNSLPFMSGTTERRRRKLPEIPKNKKSSIVVMCSQTSLAEELGVKASVGQRSVLALKCGYLLDEDSSPDSDRLHSLGDVDSGHSTAHSPTDFKSMSPPPATGGILFSRLELLEATHRALHKFLPRHHDEIELEIGDAVYVEKEAEDLWCEGVNLRTGRQGIFPSAYAVDLEYNDFDPGAQQVKRERYLLGYLGSVETLAHKGTGVVCQAVRKILARSGESPQAQPCILEVSDQGLRMVERARPPDRKGPHMDFFYSLKNVSFISFDPRYVTPSIVVMCSQTSLAEELGVKASVGQRSVLALKCGYLLDEDSSPDSDRLHSLGDVDSGHSTAHSPTDFKSMSPPPATGGILFSRLELLEATHRALHKFLPRHHDEIELEIGDAVYVEKEAEDLWCEGVNLRTGRQGIFPSAYAVDLEYNDFDPGAQQVKRERYLLGYLGSVETLAHKGTGVVCQAVRKILARSGESPQAQPCILEVSDQGLRMVERARPPDRKGPHMDFFYSLKNVSFISFDPRDNRYIGFITKHPTVQRFACHVFRGHESTRPVAEAVGRAFQRFYQKFIETAYPIEDIYIE